MTDRVVCHGLSRSLADNPARVQSCTDAREGDQRASLGKEEVDLQATVASTVAKPLDDL
jgi:hypothetical protein